jgi:hypothetical protein
MSGEPAGSRKCGGCELAVRYRHFVQDHLTRNLVFGALKLRNVVIRVSFMG